MPSSLKLALRREALRLRARVFQAVRGFFIGQGFLEVETPHLIPAPAPEAHIEPVRAGEGFLHTSPELCMKRLLAAGYPRLFQICRCFRAHERGSLHLPEFTLLEWYRAGADYRDLMTDCEALLTEVSGALGRTGLLSWGDLRISIAPPWERLPLEEAFSRYAPVSLEEAMDKDRFEEVLTREVEPRLGLQRPVFVLDYPLPMAALARRSPRYPEKAERFELYLGGVELANGFSELTDPREQRARFEEARALMGRMGKAPTPLPEPFLKSLEELPACAGIALGLDRLVMLLADAPSIDAVVAFTPEDL